MSTAAHDDAAWPCLRATGTGVVLDVSVVPGAKRTEMVGLHGGALRVRLAAPPVDGKANDALIAWLADELSLPRRSIELLRGVASRRKQLRLDCSAAHARDWLVRCCPRG